MHAAAPIRIARWLPRRLAHWLVGLIALALTGLALADPPARVGRMADATGTVWLFAPAEGQWVQAPVNRALTQGERLNTEPGVRAEVQIGSTVLRLDGDTEIEFVRLDDQRIVVQLHGGALALRLRALDKADEVELRTAEGRLLPRLPGRYRIDRADGATGVGVTTGEAVFEGQGAAQTLFSRQRGEFWMDGRLGPRLQYSITDPLRDAFAAWVAAREAEDERAGAIAHVSPEMTGAADLHRHGRWEVDPQHGPLWTPLSMPPGWSPFQFGQWAWVAPWGWTWIDAAPWGFAPSHYGRWLQWRGIWAWSPGPFVTRPVFAPAVVGWAAGAWGQGGVGVGVQFGTRPVAPPPGWFPLGPREVFVPWYAVTPRYVQSINHGLVPHFEGAVQIVQQPGVWAGRQPYLHRGWQPPVYGVLPPPPTRVHPPAVWPHPTIVHPPQHALPPPVHIQPPIHPPHGGPITPPRGSPGNPWIIPPRPPGGSAPVPPLGIAPGDGRERLHQPGRMPPPTVVQTPRPEDLGLGRPMQSAPQGQRPPSMPSFNGVNGVAPPVQRFQPPPAVVMPPPPAFRPPPPLVGNTAPNEEAARRIGREAVMAPPGHRAGDRSGLRPDEPTMHTQPPMLRR